ncbi:MAG: hypothetical protein ABR603_05180 [Pyrinomonadaceae bacterium]
MDDFQCDMLELNSKFAREALDEAAFLETARELNPDEFTVDEDGNTEVTLSFGISAEPLKPHAHLTVRLNKGGEGSVELRFHNSTMEVESENKRLPNVYDCAEWLSRFFKGDMIEAHLHAAYIFDESFTPAITLPFPLVTSEKVLAGSLVMGISLLLPKEQEIATATIQTTPKGATYLFITTTTATNLKGFNLDTELERLSPSVDAFVKRRDTDDAANNQ